jgi:hypothetical protein
MQLAKFEVNLGAVPPSDIGQAAFFALVSSGWALYASTMLALGAKGVDITAMSEEDRSKHAAECFKYVVQWMPPGHSFRKEIERYVVDALPVNIKLANLPSGAW